MEIDSFVQNIPCSCKIVMRRNHIAPISLKIFVAYAQHM
jgi:hypothetical protein